MKKYEYTELGGNVYVPRMSSFCDARVRNDVFVNKFNKEPLIVSPREWALLTSLSEIKWISV